MSALKTIVPEDFNPSDEESESETSQPGPLPSWVQSAIADHQKAMEEAARKRALEEASAKAGTESRALKFLCSLGLPLNPDDAVLDGPFITIDGLRFRWYPYVNRTSGDYAYWPEHLRAIGECSNCGQDGAEGGQIEDFQSLGSFYSSPKWFCPNGRCCRRDDCQPLRPSETSTDRLINALREIIDEAMEASR